MKKNIILALFFIISFDVFSQESESPNIILMIGDGMGLTQITSGMYSNNNKVALEDFQYIGLSKTHSYDNLVTESAAGATAMSTGKKTNNGVLGLDHMGNPQKSILFICQDKGYSTALVATSNILHATPAAFFANIDDRYKYEDIADQMTKSGINYFVGGGEQYFNSRKDKRNIINEMTENGYEFVYNISDFEKNKSDYIGFFTAKDEPYYVYNRKDEPVELFKEREPYLARSTKSTLEKLKELGNPFFIMIEGSQIDWGGHDNDQEYMISQFLEFNQTIEFVLEFAKKDKNTIVVVTADHETGGAAIVRGDLSSSTIKNLFATPNHTASMVPVFSFGPSAHLFKGIYENTEIFNKLLSIVNK